MLKTQGMLHFSLAVTDLDRSRKFYEGVLGLKVVEQSPRMVFLQTGDDYLILAKDLRYGDVLYLKEDLERISKMLEAYMRAIRNARL